MHLRHPAVSVLAFVIGLPATVRATSIIGIDLNGDIHSISTETGSFTTLGSTGVFRPHTLDRSPNGSLYTLSADNGTIALEIDESDFSTSVVASGNAITGALGGLAFVSDTFAYATTVRFFAFPRLIEVDLVADTVTSVAILDTGDDISSVTLRDDGMLVGVGRQSSSFLQINPVTAEVTVIANLGLTVEASTGLVQTADGAFFVNSSIDGSVNEIWSIDLFTGAHTLESTISGPPLLTGLATIPEPETALLLGLGLIALAARRPRKTLLISALLLPLVLPASPASASDELEKFLNEVCNGEYPDVDLDEEECAMLLACFEDPSSCSASAPESLSNPAAMSLANGGGGGGAAMAVAGASIAFRVDNSENPRMSPSANWVAFEEFNGPQRVHRAVFGDGIPGGTEVSSPSPFSAHSDLLAGVDDGGQIAGTRAQTPDPVSQSYIADAYVATAWLDVGGSYV